MFQLRAAVFSLLIIPSLLTADVTLRYQSETKPNPSLPAMMTQAMSSVAGASGSSEMKILIRGGMSFATTPMFNVLRDTAKGNITLIDPVGKHFATVPESEYAGVFGGAMPSQAAGLQAMMAQMKLTSESKITGRTAEIQGIPSEEHEVVLTISSPAMANMGPMAKVVMQLWMASADAVAKNPALREYVTSGFQSVGGLSPAETMQKALSQFPGMADGMASFMKEISSAHSAATRMHVEVFVPMLAMLAQGQGRGGGALGNFDANSAMITMNSEVVEISDKPIADSAFQIPEGYTAAPMADILAARMPKVPAAPVSPSQK